jgi:hypothetical protein
VDVRAGRFAPCCCWRSCVFVGYGILNAEEKPGPRAVPTAKVMYEAAVEVSYLARSESGTVTIEQGVVSAPGRRRSR